MNQWSISDYAFAVREAVNVWQMSIWTYCSSFNDTTLAILNFAFYVSDVNATTDYDVFITFTADEISTDVVGLTSYQWNPVSHEAQLPVTINLTTYSRTASHLFVKNIVMHEFGHALGLGHASTQDTQNGPELMYYSTSAERTNYPSTLDLYALCMVYRGNFKQSVQLPANIPYEIVQPKTDVLSDPPPDSTHLVSDDLSASILKAFFDAIQQVWHTDQTYLVVLVISIFVLIIVRVIDRKK